ncbi:MAG: bifunctional phosphoribosylaminoimidazolecarboxamide formyltransferase/IMP cyclohydrolase [Chloroflexi bacterium]|nr:bifunctional phosphoribosylaminoimidazolecarboxamide formyltransferase/IMP cyclohydrolase [Chloroflexota bacterium]
MIRRALLSVSDKDKLAELADGLTSLGWELYASGGTLRALQSDGFAARPVEDLTGFPEILDGRVKTLHPKVYGGILARRGDPDHARQLEEHGIRTIDLVAVNLYPFVETVSGPNPVALNEALEQIDIGGPTLLRAAAKNFPSVVVLVDPKDYGGAIDSLRSGILPLMDRRRLARKAFQHVALYDTAIAQYLGQNLDVAGMGDETLELPVETTFALRRVQPMRYGENPHQSAALYEEVRVGRRGPEGILASKQLHGRELSFNNVLDADAAWAVVCDFSDLPTVVVVKHGNPCGLASRVELVEAYRAALAGDPVSAYGGIIATNQPIDLATATAIADTFYEIVLAPSFHPDALAVLQKKRNVRLLEMGAAVPSLPSLELRRVRGGVLLQTADAELEGEWRVVTDRQPTEQELEDLRFAWRAARHVKSNAIVVAKGRSLLGMGAGQPNRLISVALALQIAGDASRGAVVASDAFFPFADGLEIALRAGVSAAVQPGGSVRDPEVIDAANRAGAAMVFTGIRHFRH